MSATVTCSTCGRPWPWNAKTAGHTLRCKCGSLVKIPSAVTAVPVALGESEPLPVAVAAEEDDGTTVPLAPVADAPAVKPPTKALPYRRLTPQAAAYDRQRALVLGSPVRDIWVPLGLIVLGSLLYFGRWIYLDEAFARGSIDASVQMVLNTVVTFAVVLVFGRLLDMDFGTTAGTMLKLVAVSIFPMAAAGMAALKDNCFGAIAAMGLSLGLSYALFKLLFDLELREAFFCMLLVTILDAVSWIYADRIVHALVG